MTKFVSQWTPKDIGRMMAMPGYLHEGYSWHCISVCSLDYDREDVLAGSGVILNTDNTPGSQVASGYTRIGDSDWEVLQENGGVANMFAEWEDPDNADWFSENRNPTRIKMGNTTSSSSSRLTIQTRSNVKYNLTGTEVGGMCLMMRNTRFGGDYSAQMHLGLGNYEQSSTAVGSPSQRGGSWNVFFGGSSNKGASAYDESNTLTYVYHNWAVSNTGWGVNKKTGDDFGVFIRKTPANVTQDVTQTWKWQAGTIWNGTVDIFSENPTDGKSVDIEDICGMSNATNWGGYFTMRGQNANLDVSFSSLELWVAIQ